ncbi:LuxR family transcriptional regulator [Pseudomonas sp. NBRC 111119]|uniref:LuxR family transcriptional regulator n=1 Tax=Pseudomonas sp. NBRC 111119 TaxID=1661034 RepID=UPI000ACBDF04|nr:LuxR family transcriptional regulator [Pseudomonas sp. NBRC 111119]
MNINAHLPIRPGQDPNLANLIELLPCEIDCPFTYTIIDKRTLGLSTFLSSYPLAWQQEYCSKALYRVDPVVAHGVESVAPYSWIEAFQRKPIAGQGEFEALMRQFSLDDGYTFVVHDPQHRMGLLNLFNREHSPDFHARIDAIKGTLQLALVAFHSSLNVSTSIVSSIDQALTLREQTILGWVAMGKSYSEIACICDIRERTVKFHMANVVRKLDVQTAKQAVFEASRLGIA